MLSKSELKELKSLHQKKYREQKGKFLVEGDKSVQEAIRSKAFIEQIYATEEWMPHEQQGAALPSINRVTQKELQLICELQHPNQAVAVVENPSRKGSPVIWKDHWNIYLEAVRDPGNLGTILRIADWYGLPQLICSPDCVEAFNQKVIQASMGAIFRVEVIVMGLDDLHAEAENSGIGLYGALLEGRSIHEAAAPKEGVLVMGNESKGLSTEAIARCEHRITIPKYGQAESLNVAVATGILADWFSSRS